MTKALVTLGLALAVAVGVAAPARADGTFTVEPDAGNNNFTAVFDSQVGERITAMSSALESARSISTCSP
jgi:hypothetical protein